MSCFLCCLDKSSKTHKLSDIVSSSCGENIDMVEIHTGISTYDRKLIKETAETIFSRLHLENKGVDFLIKFFKQYPHHQRFFKAFRNIPPDELVNLPKLENHGRKVMDQIAILVQHIDDHVFIREQVSSLQDRHCPRRVRSRQFKDMLTAFVDYAKSQTGSKFTAQHENAWKSFINHILAIADESINRKFDEGTTGAKEQPKVIDDVEPENYGVEEENDVISSEDDIAHGDPKDDEVEINEQGEQIDQKVSGADKQADDGSDEREPAVKESDVVLEKLDELIDQGDLNDTVLNKHGNEGKGDVATLNEPTKISSIDGPIRETESVKEASCSRGLGNGDVKKVDASCEKNDILKSPSVQNNNNRENGEARAHIASETAGTTKNVS